MNPTLASLASEVADFIRQPPAEPRRTEVFDRLAARLLALQRALNPAFAAWCASSHRPLPDGAPAEAYPAVPTEAFKLAPFSCIPAGGHTTEFQSSGTTQQVPSRHLHHADSLALYTLSAVEGFQRHLLADLGSLRDAGLLAPEGQPLFLSLTPPASEAPRSSLVHMLDAVIRRHGAADSQFLGRRNEEGAWEVEEARAIPRLEQAVAAGRPVFLLGTAFNVVHLLDALQARSLSLRLPPGSRLMETGGYKGRSRDLSRPELHRAVTGALGLPAHAIVTEYGMTELGSQAYDRVVRPLEPGGSPGGVLSFLPWARARVTCPETGRPVNEGEQGIVEVLDLANVWSVAVIRTSDLAIRRGASFEWVGRAAAAEPRGCSRMTA